MSIYVSIATLYDHQLKFTLKDIYEKSINPKDIFVGIGYTDLERTDKQTKENFLLEIQEIVDNNKNIKLKIFSEEYSGIGHGRNNALTMYDNQDYVLQIDAHTMLEYGWDEQLISLHKEAVGITKNEKTIITSYLSPFTHDESDNRSYYSLDPQYPYQLPGSRSEKPQESNGWTHIDTGVPFLQALTISDFTKMNPMVELVINNRKFLPSPKVCAQFIFGNHHFVKNSGLPRNCIFWEEEVIQSINLINDGFSLIFANTPIKLLHFNLSQEELPADPESLKKILKRESAVKIQNKTFENMKKNYLEYINDEANKEKIKNWERYSMLSVLEREYAMFYIPEHYYLPFTDRTSGISQH
jgi:hypothetical protein